MSKVSLLGASALQSAVFVGALIVAQPAMAQTTTPSAQNSCLPTNPGYDPNTGNCVQPPEGTPGQTAPGTNPGTAPADEEATAADDEQQVVVTGSRIPRPQFEGTIPGAQVTQEQIQSRAFNSAIEALNDIPLVGAGASPFGTNGGQPGSLGAAFVDLLDLGTNRTLTLVNGRRFVSGNQGTLFVSGNTTGSQVDLSVIPTELVSRFDVLTVGGAAAYGSDAIAGVVNAILVDDYDGIKVSALSGISDRGDGFNYRFSAIAGKNFLDDRANVTVSYERVHDDGIVGNSRDFIRANAIAPTFFGNGGVRNPNFTRAIGATQNAGTGAFLPTAGDMVAGNVATEAGIFGGTLLVSGGGTVFAAPVGTVGTFTQGPISGIPGTTLSTAAPTVPLSVAGNLQIVPGTPVNSTFAGCSITNVTSFCNFAPTALPAGTAAQTTAFSQAIITRFAPTQVAAGTQAQRNTLAVQLLQANLPTPREFFAANPTADVNSFLARFTNFGQLTTTTPFLTVATTGPFAAQLPRTAVPLRFNDAGNLVSNTTCLTPTTPGTLGGAPCSDNFDNPANYNILRTEQDRDIGNVFAHFDITPNLTVYTEGLFARVKTVSPQNTVASANSITNTSAENGALVLSINNPFLDAADRATLIAAGVNATTGQFLVSRTNQDLAPDGFNPITNLSKTYRAVGGIKGDFDLIGQNHTFDTSLTWGRNDAAYTRIGLLDVEYALAVDAVRNPANGQTVCRSQIDRAGALGTRDLPRGIAAVDIIRTVGPDGVVVENVVVRRVTDAQIAQCVALNPFGFNQLSDAARDYVTDETRFENRNDQLFAQASLAGSLFNLPAGKLGYALSGDYRKDKIDFQVDQEISALGRTRSAPLARTQGTVENYELGAEVRIPIFGDDFNVPLFRNLDFTPAIRFVRQKGEAPDVRLVSGQLQTNDVDTGWDKIYSIAGSWRPVRDITFRGNVTRSLRQPSVVELFLGGQPAFNAFTDPCDNRVISGGNRPAVRRANCEAAVIAAGIATDQAGAATFLQSFLNPGVSLTGAFSGSPDLQPERGRSWTVGGVIKPSFIPGLSLSADYINVKLLDRIIPTTLTTALQLCFDEPGFPDTSSAVGVNVCNFFRRNTQASGEPAFQVANGFNSGFINLGALQVNAINATMSYDLPLNRWFNSNIGSLSLYANAYHLINYKSSSTGDLNDKNVVFDLAGDFTHATWEVQGRARYEHPTGFYTQWTTNWQNRTCAIGAADICTTVEEFDLLKIPAFATHDASFGWRFGEAQKFTFQVAVANVFDKNFAVASPQALALGVGGIVDQIGRRYRVSTSIRF